MRNSMKALYLSILLIALSFFSTHLSAAIIPSNRNDYCQRFQTPEISTTQLFASNIDNLMSFRNQGGLFNAGVCWWHSRFQRNILYLSLFRPDLPKPSRHDALRIIRKIREGKNIILIPGFHNFSEFSNTYKKEIIKELAEWQLFDGIILSAWINGLKGNTKEPAPKMKKMMDELYQYVSINKKVAYQKLQIKGIVAHAWLVVGMKKNDNGYDLGVIDSNYPTMTMNYNYKLGQENFYYESYGYFVPYLEFTREEKRLVSIGKSFCGLGNFKEINDYDFDRDLELDIDEHNRVY